MFAPDQRRRALWPPASGSPTLCRSQGNLVLDGGAYIAVKRSRVVAR